MPTQSAAFDATTRRVHVVVRYTFRALLFSHSLMFFRLFVHTIHIRGCLDEKTHHTRKVSRFDARARALSVGYARKRDERRDGYGNTWITIPFDYKKPNSK